MTPRELVAAGIKIEASVSREEVDIDALLPTPENPRNVVGGLTALKVSSMDGSPACEGAYNVSWSRADIDGLGPLLYDLAIDLIHPFPLTSDREEVSSAAKRVWDYYDSKRSDIEALQLDDLKNTLTTTDSDNCPQWSAARWSPSPRQWPESSLSRGYRRADGRRPTLDALRALDAITLKRR